MILIDRNLDQLTYKHKNGYVVDTVSEFITDCLDYYGIDIIHYIEMQLNRWKPVDVDQKIRVVVERDFGEDASWSSVNIKIVKK